MWKPFNQIESLPRSQFSRRKGCLMDVSKIEQAIEQSEPLYTSMVTNATKNKLEQNTTEIEAIMSPDASKFVATIPVTSPFRPISTDQSLTSHRSISTDLTHQLSTRSFSRVRRVPTFRPYGVSIRIPPSIPVPSPDSFLPKRTAAFGSFAALPQVDAAERLVERVAAGGTTAILHSRADVVDRVRSGRGCGGAGLRGAEHRMCVAGSDRGRTSNETALTCHTARARIANTHVHEQTNDHAQTHTNAHDVLSQSSATHTAARGITTASATLADAALDATVRASGADAAHAVVTESAGSRPEGAGAKVGDEGTGMGASSTDVSADTRMGTSIGTSTSAWEGLSPVAVLARQRMAARDAHSGRSFPAAQATRPAITLIDAPTQTTEYRQDPRISKNSGNGFSRPRVGFTVHHPPRGTSFLDYTAASTPMSRTGTSTHRTSTNTDIPASVRTGADTGISTAKQLPIVCASSAASIPHRVTTRRHALHGRPAGVPPPPPRPSVNSVHTYSNSNAHADGSGSGGGGRISSVGNGGVDGTAADEAAAAGGRMGTGGPGSVAQGRRLRIPGTVGSAVTLLSKAQTLDNAPSPGGMQTLYRVSTEEGKESVSGSAGDGNRDDTANTVRTETSVGTVVTTSVTEGDEGDDSEAAQDREEAEGAGARVGATGVGEHTSLYTGAYMRVVVDTVDAGTSADADTDVFADVKMEMAAGKEAEMEPGAEGGRDGRGSGKGEDEVEVRGHDATTPASATLTRAAAVAVREAMIRGDVGSGSERAETRLLQGPAECVETVGVGEVEKESMCAVEWVEHKDIPTNSPTSHPDSPATPSGGSVFGITDSGAVLPALVLSPTGPARVVQEGYFHHSRYTLRHNYSSELIAAAPADADTRDDTGEAAAEDAHALLSPSPPLSQSAMEPEHTRIAAYAPATMAPSKRAFTHARIGFETTDRLPELLASPEVRPHTLTDTLMQRMAALPVPAGMEPSFSRTLMSQAALQAHTQAQAAKHMDAGLTTHTTPSATSTSTAPVDVSRRGMVVSPSYHLLAHANSTNSINTSTNSNTTANSANVRVSAGDTSLPMLGKPKTARDSTPSTELQGQAPGNRHSREKNQLVPETADFPARYLLSTGACPPSRQPTIAPPLVIPTTLSRMHSPQRTLTARTHTHVHAHDGQTSHPSSPPRATHAGTGTMTDTDASSAALQPSSISSLGVSAATNSAHAHARADVGAMEYAEDVDADAGKCVSVRTVAGFKNPRQHVRMGLVLSRRAAPPPVLLRHIRAPTRAGQLRRALQTAEHMFVGPHTQRSSALPAQEAGVGSVREIMDKPVSTGLGGVHARLHRQHTFAASRRQLPALTTSPSRLAVMRAAQPPDEDTLDSGRARTLPVFFDVSSERAVAALLTEPHADRAGSVGQASAVDPAPSQLRAVPSMAEVPFTRHAVAPLSGPIDSVHTSAPPIGYAYPHPVPRHVWPVTGMPTGRHHAHTAAAHAPAEAPLRVFNVVEGVSVTANPQDLAQARDMAAFAWTRN